MNTDFKPRIIFRDPVFDGAADPTVIKRESDGKLFMFYTQRRATIECPENSVEWCYGTKIGVAVCDDTFCFGQPDAVRGSADNLKAGSAGVAVCDNFNKWLYSGTAELPFIEDKTTYWAPEVIFDGENYRMFVTYIDGVFSEWAGDASIEQYISSDLLEWRRVGRVEIESSRVIDPCLYPLPSGGWRMWYKDEKRGSRTCFCDTDDFASWRYGGFATDETAQEGPNVFALGGYFWLVADVWDGLAVYRSGDLTRFERQEGNILPGAASHADVFCENGRARLVYFTYPEGGRRSAVCECELTVEDGALKAV